MIHLTHEEIEPAFADLQTARQLDPSMKEIGVNLLNLLIQCGEFDEAISTGSILKLRLPDDQKLHLNLGAAYGMIGDAKHAAEAFEAITKKYPNYALAWYNRGQAEIELGQFEAAIESLRRADELGKKLQKWSYPSSQALSEAKLLEELLKRLPEALDGRRPPREAKELIHFAHVATTREKFDAAAQWYEKLFTLDPQAKSDLDLRLSAIGAAARSEKHRDLALRWLKEVLKELADEPWEKDARAARSVRHELQRLKFAMALAPVRDGKAISEEWERFWTDFETLRKRVRERIPVTFSE
jgi:tetratricopeptide (TPR) repeat protein